MKPINLFSNITNEIVLIINSKNSIRYFDKGIEQPISFFEFLKDKDGDIGFDIKVNGIAQDFITLDEDEIEQVDKMGFICE